MRRMLAASICPGEPGPGAFEHAVIPSATKATLTQHPRNVFWFKAFLSDSDVTHAAYDPSQKGLLAEPAASAQSHPVRHSFRSIVHRAAHHRLRGKGHPLS